MPGKCQSPQGQAVVLKWTEESMDKARLAQFFPREVFLVEDFQQEPRIQSGLETSYSSAHVSLSQ